jgi:molybdopterin synthase catalytic subunit
VAENAARVVDAPIDGTALLRAAASPADGAALLFYGVVREENGGRAVSSLEYSAYRPMAEREMLAIADEARARFGTGRIVLQHRVGLLRIGEASVAVAVAAPHRGEAYAASRYVIEELKRRVPVWKREGYVDGETAWVPGYSAGAEAVR